MESSKMRRSENVGEVLRQPAPGDGPIVGTRFRPYAVLSVVFFINMYQWHILSLSRWAIRLLVQIIACSGPGSIMPSFHPIWAQFFLLYGHC